MTRIEQIKNWLASRQQKYADGLAIFKGIARSEQLFKYDKYLSSAPEDIDTLDGRFTMLVNLLSRIYADAIRQPDLYPSAHEEVVVTEDHSSEVESRTKKISRHEESINYLSRQLEDLDESNSENTYEIAEIRDAIGQHEKQIQSLQEELDELSKPGVKVVKESSMPPAIKMAYARIKEIVPLIASLHSELSDGSVEDKQRKKVALQLCKLDDERRSLWSKIDAWSEGSGPHSSDKENPVARGYALARSIKRLRQNIANCKLSAEKAKTDGRETVYNNAIQRIRKYEEELSRVEKEIAGERID